MEPIVVEVRRGSVVEAVHRVHAVAVRDGEVVASAGDPGHECFTRSSSKPIQALPLARARHDLDDRDLAIASASHRGEPEQVAAVRQLLAKAPAREEELDCGVQDGRPRDALHHNCSGKHAGMLAVCRARGWPSEGYRHADHPLQRELLEEHARAAEVDPAAIETAVDGCGVVTFAFALDRMALAFARLGSLPGGDRVAAAMRTHPDLIAGRGAPDTELMRALPGWIAKGGAEGLLCAAGPDGTGVALKVEDGNGYRRAVGPALAAFLAELGHALPGLAREALRNTHGETVGEIAVADRNRPSARA